MSKSTLTLDPLFVGATRPPMRWGVTYTAVLINMVFTMEVFLLTKNLLTLGLAIPIHGLCALLCARDPRFFDLALLWCRTRLPALAGNYRFWRASSHSPLSLDVPDGRGCRRAVPSQAYIPTLSAIDMSANHVGHANQEHTAHPIILTTTVIPAKAGIQSNKRLLRRAPTVGVST